MKRHWIGVFVCGWISSPALASEADRINQLEQQMQILQRQLYRGADGSAVAAGGAGGGTGTANLQAEFGRMQEEFSQLRGQIEENRHQVEQLARQQQLQQEDTQYRLEQLEQKAGGVAPAATPSGATPAPAPAATPAPTAEPKPAAGPAETTGTAEASPSDAKGLYNHAIGQMNKTQYDAAAASFGQFIEKFPNDPLIGNAFYWLGETYYVRNDYVKAADQFRQGFEAAPTGIKAPDNLLKLAMSLEKTGKHRESCIVLKQIKVKYAKGPDTVTSRAQREIEQQKCP